MAVHIMMMPQDTYPALVATEAAILNIKAFIVNIQKYIQYYLSL